MANQIFYKVHYEQSSVEALDFRDYKNEVPAIEEGNVEEGLFILINKTKKTYQIVCSKCLAFASEIIRKRHKQEVHKTIIEEVRQWNN